VSDSWLCAAGLDFLDFHCNNGFQRVLKMTILVKERRIEEVAQGVLLEQLKGVPFLQVGRIAEQRRTGDAQIDFMASVRTRDGRFRLVCEVKSSGQPRIARQACLQLLEYTRLNPRDYPVFVAPFISAQSAEICEGLNVGYLDLAGNCRLAFDQVYIQKGQYPNPATVKRELRSLYSPKAERLLRVLLTNPRKTWKTQPLAREADVSLGQVANVKKLLADREWIRTYQDGLILSNPNDLLEEWAKNYRFERNRVEEFYTLESIGEIEAALSSACEESKVPLGFTAFSGAARLSPAVRYQRVSAYVSGDIRSLAKAAGLKPVPSGANVSLIAPYDDGVLYGSRRVEGLPVISATQIYLDLLGVRGRGEEAANAILEEVLKPSWQ
jgi:Transcriptional regulator, AbiEi antitoxin, Type IV TA system